MKRIDFLRKSFGSLGAVAIAVPLITACKEDDIVANTTTTTTSGTVDTTVTPSSCSVTNSETEGPFPTKSPATLVIKDITSDRTGTPLTINIVIRNVNNSCNILANAITDIWHCDAAGEYSEYGGTGMQKTNYTSVHFLRGRQTTDSTGVASFKSIYPGWYSGRAPHIHVHVYNASGTSLLVTQIAFPENISAVVYAQGVYASHGQADTKNATDNVFGDGFTNEMSTVTGSVADGYVLVHTIYVKA
ncbi:intradiol ring-cleavage dioxygenase [Arcicella aquatica]|uniref:Intradiol ring-cleavage dioxygenase n=1 Tax=Arcicella aquatica TaxID=217141 RepID=A0ABU5QHX7_9BACT|nr:intradiol ring-cleavage dioxygenase [Arcicella aquatica]MEA5256324.1 intradiol ring-cleavage dioxygenase [Arcicella aquatica]